MKKGNGGKRSDSKRRDSEGGYEGGVERHGQANDFVDPDSSSDEDKAVSTPKISQTQSAKPSLPRRLPDLSAAAIEAALKVADREDDEDEEDREEVFRSSTRKNKNPSKGSHSHGRLPLHSRNSSFSSNAGGGLGGGFFSRPKTQRSASISSTRSVEASSHPFPHLGLKRGHTLREGEGKKREEEHKSWEEEYEWKSVEEKRLDEDERKEKHWKRWGPYVSERQWVGPLFLLFYFYLRYLLLTSPPTPSGNSPRRLLCQRRRLDSFPPRTRTLTSLPMGRRWIRRYLRQPREDVF